MKRSQIFALFVLLVCTGGGAAAQETHINVLLDNPLPFWAHERNRGTMQVCYLREMRCVPVSPKGFFSMELPTYQDSLTLYVSSIYRGVIPIKVSTQTDSLQFIQSERYPVRNPFFGYSYSPYAYPKVDTTEFHWGFHGSFGVDLSIYDLDELAPIFSEDEYGMLADSVSVLVLTDFNLSYKRLEMGFAWGFGDRTVDKDGMRFDARRRRYDLRAGYRLIERRNFFSSGYGGIRWARWRILRGFENEVDLDEFTSTSDTDIRVNQFFWETGIRTGLVIYPDDYDVGITMGFAMSYLFNMHQTPGIASDLSRLNNKASIRAQDPAFSIFFGITVP